MEKNLIKPLFYAGVFLIYILTISSCNKSETSPANATAGTFTWSTGGVTYSADNDTAFVQGPFTVIAKKDQNTPASLKIFEIDLSAFGTGAYALTAAGVNQVNYITTSNVITSQSGTLNITANTGTTLSGNFTTTLTGGVAMTGTFTNVPIKP
jgi:hypothetical protein